MITWSDILRDPCLQDLPFKIELNEHGTIMMTPASNRHGDLQALLVRRIDELTSSGQVMVECAIETPRGVKVADVAWKTDAFVAEHGREVAYTVAPALCIEVISPSNSRVELEEKRGLYFELGAIEVWFCHEDGRLEMFDASGAIEISAMVPGMTTLD